MAGRAAVVWILLMVLAILNGAIRNLLIAPRLGEQTGHVVSTLLLSLVILVVAWFTIPWIAPNDLRDAWVVGALWVAWTVAFEFLAGHYVFHQPWARLVADYEVARGRIWPLVLIASLLAPVIASRARGPR